MMQEFLAKTTDPNTPIQEQEYYELRLDDLGFPARNENAETCWRNYVRKNGIRSLQQSWQIALETDRDRVIWDANARCFRVKK